MALPGEEGGLIMGRAFNVGKSIAGGIAMGPLGAAAGGLQGGGGGRSISELLNRRPVPQEAPPRGMDPSAPMPQFSMPPTAQDPRYAYRGNQGPQAQGPWANQRPVAASSIAPGGTQGGVGSMLSSALRRR